MDELAFVRERLKELEPDRNLREIAQQAGVGHSWLRMFARGEIPDPSYSRVKALHATLKRMKAPAPADSQTTNGADA